MSAPIGLTGSPKKCKSCGELEQKITKLSEKLKKTQANIEKYKEDNRQLVITAASEKILLQEKLDQVLAENKHYTKVNGQLKKAVTKAKSARSGRGGGSTLPDIADGEGGEEDLEIGEGVEGTSQESTVFQSPIGKLQHSKSFVV